MNSVIRFAAALAFVALGGLVLSPPSLSKPTDGQHLNRGKHQNFGQDACPRGRKILNVNYKIANSLDSGTGQNDYGKPWWAYLDYVLQVQVVQTGPNEFCVRVKNQGSFESVGGDGPGCANDGNCGTAAGRLEPGVVGTFQGGYSGTFEGTFAPNGQKTKGNLGKFDHGCDAATGSCNGAGVTRWLGLYFTGVTNNNIFASWGWVYHAGNNGSWINSSSGNFGNITGD